MDITRPEESVNEVRDRVRPRIDAARRRLESLSGQATRVIRKHTVACMLGALALGYVVARVARRQS